MIKKNKYIDFIVWVFENHFRMIDIKNGVHYFASESMDNIVYNETQLFEIYTKCSSEQQP